MSLWTSVELEALFDCKPLVKEIDGVSIDSRSIGAGDLFVALQDIRDGHDFIPSAEANGASSVMAHRAHGGSVHTIDVDDTLIGLNRLAEAARARMSGSVVAITGSSGKTTLRHWLQQALSRCGRVHASVGSYNNHWGVPLSMARMPQDTEFGIFEVGTNHAGEIEPLSRLVQPDIAILINVLPAHIGNFESMDVLESEKLSISSGLNQKGTFILPQRFEGHPLLERLSGECVTVGLDEGAVTGRFNGVTVVGQAFGKRFEVEVPKSLAERVDSFLIMVAVYQLLGLSVDDLADAVKEFEPPEGRGNVRHAGGVTVVDDSYNANPVSMEMALSNLAEDEVSGKRIAVLGEMLELGALSQASHQQVANASEEIDLVLSVGEGFQNTQFNTPRIHFNSASDIDLDELVGELEAGDRILVKGSNRVFWVNNFVEKLLAKIAEESGANLNINLD